MANQTSAEAKKTLSLSGVARALDLSYPRATRLFDEGVFVPDFMGPHNTALFLERRLPELRALVQL